MKKSRKPRLFLLLATLIASTVISCTSPTLSNAGVQYKTYTLKHYGVSFSFEYPVGYKIVSTYLKSNPNASIGIQFSLQGTDPTFAVNIDSPLAEKVDPAAAANTAGSHTPDEELERTSISIAGTNGEFVAYTLNFQNQPTVNREVFFNVNGVLWNLYIYSSPANADKATLAFDHIISTFKVLQ